MSYRKPLPIREEAFRIRFEYADGRVEFSRSYALPGPAKARRTSLLDGFARGWYRGEPPVRSVLERSVLTWEEVPE